ncbi:MAG: response regulator [Spirochaetales bacterium]|nr:response regulator [Spirochaetales bacterium]
MKNVLIIDDDERIRHIIKIQLHKTDFNLLEADNREIALETLRGSPVDVIICDIKMKDTTGFILLKELKATYPHIPVIMLTGFIDKNVSEKAKRMGSFAFITKPVRREKLIETIRQAVDDGGGPASPG